MKIAAQIISGILLLPWPMLMIMSPMGFFAGDMDANSYLKISALFYYPVIFAFFFFLKDWSFLGFPPKVFLIVTIVLPTLGLTVLGVPKMYLNKIRGISNSSYSLNESGAYYAGNLIDSANPSSFKILNDIYAHDEKHVFCRHKVVEGADPMTFEILPANGEAGVDAKDKNQKYYFGKIVTK